MAIKNDHYSPTRLAIRCPRKLIKDTRRDPKEGYVLDITDEGKEYHNLISESLKSGDFSKIESLFCHEAKGLKKIYEREPESEKWLYVTIEIEGTRYQIWGRADIVIPSGREVIDAKGTWDGKIDLYIQRQLKYYAYMLMKVYNWKKCKTGIYWYRWDRVDMWQEFDAIDCIEIEKEIAKEILWAEKVLNEEDEKPLPNSQDCLYCDYSVSCPAVDLKGDEPLEKIVTELVKIHNKYDRLNKIVQERLRKTDEGRIDISETKFIGYYLVDKLDIDPLEFLELAEKVHLPEKEMRKLVNINQTEFKKFVKEAPTFENIAMAYTDTRYTGARGGNK